MPLDTLFHSFPQLETRDLLLRRMGKEDAPALFAILSDEEVARYYDEAAYTQVAQAEEQIEAWEKGFINRRCIRWGITRKGEREILGTCGFHGLHAWHRRAAIGYELGRPYWRQGIMSRALQAVLGLGFGEMELNRIEALVMPGNEASIKLLKKLGFRNEGLLRAYENWGDKGLADVCMLSLLKKEWEAGGDKQPA